MKIYLAGTITTEDNYFQDWRDTAEKYLLNHGVIPLTPLSQKALESSKDGGITSSVPNKSILMRDYAMVKSSHLILANLKVKGYSGVPVKKPLIGTWYELGWGWDMGKPIITVVEPDNYLFMNHPFIDGVTTRRFENLEDALKDIVTYWNWNYEA